MGRQTPYAKGSIQELTQFVKEDLMNLKNFGTGNLDDIDIDDFFYKKKLKNLKRYERMYFNTNGHKHFSEEVESIKSSLIASGFLKYSLLIVGE